MGVKLHNTKLGVKSRFIFSFWKEVVGHIGSCLFWMDLRQGSFGGDVTARNGRSRLHPVAGQCVVVLQGIIVLSSLTP